MRHVAHMPFQCLTALAALALAACGPAATTAPVPVDAETTVSSDAPTTIGACVDTTVTLVGSRLEGMPDSGSYVEYANGLSQVSYDVIPGMAHSQVGDAVRVCLIQVPEACPPGDDRGKVYTSENARTHERWEAPDSQHMCGGA